MIGFICSLLYTIKKLLHPKPLKQIRLKALQLAVLTSKQEEVFPELRLRLLTLLSNFMIVITTNKECRVI